jgi:serine phosphatase RsbU (regulator of sigma subunit)/PAS domain-containing protein
LSAGTERGRFELLASVEEITDETLPADETVARLLNAVVPALADVATLDVISPAGELRRLGSRVAGPGGEELEAPLQRSIPLSDAPGGLGRAIADAESQLIARVTDDDLHAMANSAADYDFLCALELRSALFVPLRARGRTVGALACGVGTSGRDYDEEDLRFAAILSGRLALALDNAGLTAAVSGLQRRLEATLASLAEAVLVRDAGGRIVFANPAAANLLQVPSPEAVTTATPGSLMALYDVFDAQGRRLTLDDLPSMALGRGERPDPLLVRNVIRATGEERWLLHKATPVHNEDGSLALIVSVVEDLTEVKRAELAQRLLAEAGRALSSSLDYEQTLQHVAQLAVPELADWCGVSMLTDGDLLQPVAVAHVDPDKAALVREFGGRHPPRLGDPVGLAEVARTGKAQLIPSIAEAFLGEAQLSQDQIELVRALLMTSVIIVPLAIADRPPIGALSLVMAESGRVFDEGDLALAEELGRRATTAVENARLYTERSLIASTLQRSLLPPELPGVPGFRLASLYRPAGEHNDVGGDFYDVFEVPGGWMVVVGDVAGRGAEAAALTSLSRYTLRTAGRLLGDPIAAMEQLNQALRERPALSLVSVCCALLREMGVAAQADVALAGHPQPYLVRGGRPTPVGSFAPFLGAYDCGGWHATTVRLEPGDELVLYTDGVIDAVGATERFGEERLARALDGTAGAEEAVRRIDQSIGAFAHGPPVDDTAILVVERAAVT